MNAIRWTPFVAAILAAPVDSARSQQVTIQGTGIVVAARRATITAAARGRVEEIQVEEGQLVKKGATLFRLDHRQQELELKQGDLKLQLAKLKLDQLKSGVNEEARKVILAEIARAEAAVKSAEADYQRIKKLLAPHAAVPEELLRKEADYLAAQAELKKQQAVLKEVESKPSKNEIDVATLHVVAAQLELERVKIALQDTVIYAPFDGIVYRLGVEPGSFTNPAMTGLANTSALCEIVDMTAPRIDASVPETAFFKLRVGMPCQVKVNSIPDKTFEGTVERISPIIERGSIGIRVKLNGEGAVPLGAAARVEMVVK